MRRTTCWDQTSLLYPGTVPVVNESVFGHKAMGTFCKTLQAEPWGCSEFTQTKGNIPEFCSTPCSQICHFISVRNRTYRTACTRIWRRLRNLASGNLSKFRRQKNSLCPNDKGGGAGNFYNAWMSDQLPAIKRTGDQQANTAFLQARAVSSAIGQRQMRFPKNDSWIAQNSRLQQTACSR